METSTFQITDRIRVEGRSLYLLNQPFEDRIQEDNFHDTMCRVSSYHQPEAFKVEWPRYNKLMNGEVIVATASGTFTVEEALTFMGQNNGFALTRDNLFMLWALYHERLQKYQQILAAASPDLLVSHTGNPSNALEGKICPLLKISQKDKDEHRRPIRADYDWYWYKTSNGRAAHDGSIAFFKPSVIIDSMRW
ncbi:MAG TPA: hypothetical protein VEF04_02045 [Blastocatellia bacterium]|nr:hypothetical protein [Blastocatellia bacterium]